LKKVDPKIFSKVQGARGEERGKHRNKKGKEWNDFVDDVRNHGVEEIVSINVEPDGTIQVHEGNHRIDAALEAGLDRIPVQIRYYGNAQDLQIPFFNMED
jgi:ParB-like chromosome segregation protein Spo0J